MTQDISLDPTPGYGADHLPLAIATVSGDPSAHVVTRVGNGVLDLFDLSLTGLDLGVENSLLHGTSLNQLFSQGHGVMGRLRMRLQDYLHSSRHASQLRQATRAIDDLVLQLPIAPTNYVDFYSSLHHATNLGRLFRPDGDPLTPNWRYLPIAYHGRTSTILVSGTPIQRPAGLRIHDGQPTFGPSRRLDIEAEVGFIVGKRSQLGSPVATSEFFDFVAGIVLVNDWSARDIQSFEYQPLGPFLGKSFATSISAWVTPLEALQRARVDPVPQDPPPVPYLRDPDPWNLAIELVVELNGTEISRPPFASTYWTPGQQLAHQTINGADVRVGDLYASGTVSGPDADQFGSIIELTHGGDQPLQLADGHSRSFLEDGDRITLRASAPSLDGGIVQFGEVAGQIVKNTGSGAESQ